MDRKMSVGFIFRNITSESIKRNADDKFMRYLLNKDQCQDTYLIIKRLE